MPETYWDKSGRTDPCNQLQVIEKVILRAGAAIFPWMIVLAVLSTASLP
jgi:hypothetical protein